MALTYPADAFSMLAWISTVLAADYDQAFADLGFVCLCVLQGYVDMCTFAAKPSTPSKRSQPSSTGTPSRTFHVHEEGMKAGLPSSALLGSQRWVSESHMSMGSRVAFSTVAHVHTCCHNRA